MTSIGEPLRRRRESRFKWSIMLAVGLLGLTVLAGVWLAFSAHAPTTIAVDAASGALLVTGPEQEFVGRVDGIFEGQPVTVTGLPSFADLADDGTALRAVCALRSDPTAQWSADSDSLRAHLASPELNRLCREMA